MVKQVENAALRGEAKPVAVEPERTAVFATMSESALSDWARPEEDDAWANL